MHSALWPLPIARCTFNQTRLVIIPARSSWRPFALSRAKQSNIRNSCQLFANRASNNNRPSFSFTHTLSTNVIPPAALSGGAGAAPKSSSTHRPLAASAAGPSSAGKLDDTSAGVREQAVQHQRTQAGRPRGDFQRNSLLGMDLLCALGINWSPFPRRNWSSSGKEVLFVQ